MESFIKLIMCIVVYQITISQFPNFYHIEAALEGSYYHLMYEEGSHTNMCPETQEYEEKVVIPFNHTVLETTYRFCFSFTFRCAKHRNVTRRIYKTTSILKTKTVFKCCKGYEEINKNCEAACPEGCVHGDCKEPNACNCNAGWKGSDCSIECELGWYGKGCEVSCNCNNGATCDRFNGTCFCAPGYTGAFCESECHSSASGKECTSKCNCENGATCRESDDICECTPGYYGHYCEKECEPLTFGRSCSEVCTCDEAKTELCSPINGKCQCAPGWKGDRCDKPCDSGRWGRRCEVDCNCGLSRECHPVSGACSCPPGWHGLHCEEICPLGFFEKDCKMKCPDCIHEPGTCHHETGWCNCPNGTTGHQCNLDCPQERYGKDCANFCLCNNNSTCDSVTGTCSCTSPGWTGTDCSLPCPEGMYGEDCNFTCNCSNSALCDATNGDCFNEEDDMLYDSFKIYPDSMHPSFYINIILGFSLFILLAFTITVVWYKIKKKSIPNIHQSLRIRFQRPHRFQKSELEKEDTSTTNVYQEDNSSMDAIGQFMNPMYESTNDFEKVDFRPNSMVHSTNGSSEKNSTAQMKDPFEEVQFSIPGCDLGPSTSRPEIKISFGNNFSSRNTDPETVINISSSGNKFYFPKTELESSEPSVEVDVMNEHRYENIGDNK